MKRIISVAMALILALTLSVLTVGAAETETYDLLTTKGNWISNPHNDVEAKQETIDGKTVISGSVPNSWPSIDLIYLPTSRVNVNIEDYSIVYDFTVESGYTNVSFIFDNNYTFPLSNSAMGEHEFEVGSGDLPAGTYQGEIALIDFIDASDSYRESKFEITNVNDDDTLTFFGIKVYSVSGGVITFTELSLVPNENAGNDDDTEKDESKSDESGTDASVASDASIASEDASNGSGGLDTTSIIVIVVAAVVVAGAIITVIAVKKKK